jgi:hypothetical protein
MDLSLAFVKTYCFLSLTLIVVAYAAAYGMSIRNSAWSDDRNMGTGLSETNRLAFVIFRERRSKRDLATIILYLRNTSNNCAPHPFAGLRMKRPKAARSGRPWTNVLLNNSR